MRAGAVPAGKAVPCRCGRCGRVTGRRALLLCCSSTSDVWHLHKSFRSLVCACLRVWKNGSQGRGGRDSLALKHPKICPPHSHFQPIIRHGYRHRPLRKECLSFENSSFRVLAKLLLATTCREHHVARLSDGIDLHQCGSREQRYTQVAMVICGSDQKSSGRTNSLVRHSRKPIGTFLPWALGLARLLAPWCLLSINGDPWVDVSRQARNCEQRSAIYFLRYRTATVLCWLRLRI